MASQSAESPRRAASASLSQHGRAEQASDLGSESVVGGPDEGTNDDAEQRRKQQQRQVAEEPGEIGLPRRRRRDPIERAFCVPEEPNHGVEERDETDDPSRDLTGVVHVLEQPPQHGVQRGVPLGHLARQRHRGLRAGCALEDLEDPEPHHQQRDQRERRVVGERRRLKPELMHGDTAHGGDRDPEQPVLEGAPPPERRAIPSPDRARACDDGVARPRDPLAQVAEHGEANVPTAAGCSRS